MPSRILITDRNNIIVGSDVDFSEYVFEIDTFNIANPFDITLANLPDIPEDLEKWYGITLIVETKTMFRGVIQRISRSGEKGTIDIRISGKNRASILVESSCTSYKDFRNEKPKDIIDKLIQQTAFYPQPVTNAQEAASVDDWDDSGDIDDFNTAIDDSIRNNKAFITRGDKTEYSQEFSALPVKKHYKIEPGDNVFDKINELVKSQGYDVVYQPNGTLFIGDISKKRLNESPQIKHQINLVKRDRTDALQQKEDNNNIITWDISEDTSSLYSSVTVVSQNQNGTNKSATATDSTVLDKKTLVMQINDDDSTPEKEAIRIREDNRIDSFQAFYTAPDHIDDVGEPWGTNRTVDMNDTFNGVTGEHVLYSTTFVFSRQDGFKTELSISYARRKALNV